MSDTANTILAQLGGNKFIAMTGAKTLVGGAAHLQFKLPRAKDGINTVRIELMADDTYTVQFWSIRGLRMALKSTVEGVYTDNLRQVFESTTGLATSLGTMCG